MGYSTNRSSLFLVELVLDLLIFVICSVVCTGLLVSAYGISQKSQNLTNGVYKVQGVAEQWKAGNIKTQNGEYIINYDDNSELTLKDEQGADGVKYCDITITDKDKTPVFSIKVSKTKGVAE